MGPGRCLREPFLPLAPGAPVQSCAPAAGPKAFATRDGSCELSLQAGCSPPKKYVWAEFPFNSWVRKIRGLDKLNKSLPLLACLWVMLTKLLEPNLAPKDCSTCKAGFAKQVHIKNLARFFFFFFWGGGGGERGKLLGCPLLS